MPPQLTQLTPDASWLLVVDKPLGWSSMDVVRRVRRATGLKRVGHAGTLDPLATGVVVVCLGRATKLVERLMGLPKTYEADVDLSAFTATDDREGQVQPLDIGPAALPDAAAIHAILPRFIGEVQQRPPAHSAIKVAGQRAYALARRGETVELPARTVRIDAIDVLDYAWPILSIRVACGRGTYIRSLARDLGVALHTGGHLAVLRRTAIGPFTLDRAVTERDLAAALSPHHLLDPAQCLPA
jgi:tRNA pseudouridine55 synthase